MTTELKLLYIGVCKENLEQYYPSYIRGEFLKDTFTDEELVKVVKQKNINVLMVDVFHSTFTKKLLNRLKGNVKLINFSYQSIDSLIDIKEAEKCGIAVKKLPNDIYCNEVAEFAIAQLLSACKGTIEFDQSIKRGKWDQSLHANISLQGKTLGVVGFGNIGRRIVKLCENWGMHILVSKKKLNSHPSVANVTFVELPSLVKRSNFIIFSLPLNEETFQLCNATHIQNLKEHSIIVNVSRGNIVDEKAISDALRKGRLHKYCADVFSHEPINSKHMLVQSNKTILSPHVAWATGDTLKKTYEVWFAQTTV